MIKVPADGAPEENPPAGPFSHGLTWPKSELWGVFIFL